MAAGPEARRRATDTCNVCRVKVGDRRRYDALFAADRALPRAVTRLPIELAIVSLEQVSLEQVSLVQDKADLAQQVKGRWRGGIG